MFSKSVCVQIGDVQVVFTSGRGSDDVGVSPPVIAGLIRDQAREAITEIFRSVDEVVEGLGVPVVSLVIREAVSFSAPRPMKVLMERVVARIKDFGINVGKGWGVSVIPVNRVGVAMHYTDDEPAEEPEVERPKDMDGPAEEPEVERPEDMDGPAELGIKGLA